MEVGRREGREEGGEGGKEIDGEEEVITSLQFCILEYALNCFSPSGYHFGCRVCSYLPSQSIPGHTLVKRVAQL